MSETTYYQRNKKAKLNRAKEYYKNNQEGLRESKQEITIENYVISKRM